jgi:hypothetical protein
LVGAKITGSIGNSHSAPAGRMVYNIYGLSRRWWGGGEVTRRCEILVPGSNPENHYFFLTDKGQKMVDK